MTQSTCQVLHVRLMQRVLDAVGNAIANHIFPKGGTRKSSCECWCGICRHMKSNERKGSHILVGANSGEKNKSLKLKSAEMKAGSMELRERGNQAQEVDTVCIAASLLRRTFKAVSTRGVAGETVDSVKAGVVTVAVLLFSNDE